MNNYFQLKGKIAEEALHKLAEKTFLTDWCYLNPMLPNGKELCDLLIVFGNTAIIWQLKDTKLDKSGNIKDSDFNKNRRQLLGAHRQLFKLKTCLTLTNPRRGEEEFNPSDIDNIHLISAFFGENPGMISSRIDESPVVHVFTQTFTEIILNELDTIGDFTRYLKDREKLAGTGTNLIVDGGEEEVLAYYLIKNRSFDDFHNRDSIIIENGAWKDFTSRSEYQAKKQADEVSYLWDSIIDRAHEGDSPQYEIIARELAKHDRLDRRMLGKAFMEANIIAQESNRTFRRYVALPQSDVAYCFLFQDDPEPRENRKSHLTAMCHVTRSKYIDKKIIGIATEQIIRPTCSYDFALFDVHDWSEVDQTVLEDIKSHTDIFQNPIQSNVQEDEYPQK